MLKLMKYEFKKQAFSKYIILALVGLIEIGYLVGLYWDKQGVLGTSIMLMSILAFGSMFYLAFECIDTFSKDLKQKCSYMLFLTPRTAYSIVGAKLIAAGIQAVIAAFAFFGVFVLNGTLALLKYESLNKIKEYVLILFKEIMQLEVDIPFLTAIVGMLLGSWLLTITTAFFAITLSTTFLANKKFKGIVSFVLFILINIAFSYITNIGDIASIDTIKGSLFNTLFSLVFTVITYFGTAWMLEKKVSV